MPWKREAPPVLKPSQLITDRVRDFAGLIRLATGIDQGWCPLLVVSSAWYGSRGRRVSLLLEHCDGWNM